MAVTLSELHLGPVREEQLQEVVELDRLCLGGLWTWAGYQRELASPNSRLLGLRVQRALPVSSTAEFRVRRALRVPSAAELGVRGEKGRSQLPMVGFGCFWRILEEAHITLLMVHPSYRKRGLGQLLLFSLLREAVKCKLERATLEVRASNQAALSLYQKFGFKVAGRRKGYYQQTGEDALILWRGDLAKPEFGQELAIWQQQIRDRLS